MSRTSCHCSLSISKFRPFFVAEIRWVRKLRDWRRSSASRIRSARSTPTSDWAAIQSVRMRSWYRLSRPGRLLPEESGILVVFSSVHFLGRMNRQSLPDGGPQNLGLEGLADQEGGLQLFAGQQSFGETGDEDHWQIGGAQDLLHRLDAAVAALELDVGQDQFRQGFGGETQRFLLARGLTADLVAHVGDETGDILGDQGFVLYDEDADGSLGRKLGAGGFKLGADFSRRSVEDA